VTSDTGAIIEARELPAATGPLQLYAVPQPNPLVGADWAFVIQHWRRLVTARAHFLASAVVANRLPRFAIDDGNGNVIWSVQAAQFIAAAGAVNISLGVGSGVTSAPIGTDVNLPLPNLYLRENYRFSVVTAALDVGDQWSAIVLGFSDL
jgi:hypothetical protein